MYQTLQQTTTELYNPFFDRLLFGFFTPPGTPLFVYRVRKETEEPKI
jgi:hypothetical protein